MKRKAIISVTAPLITGILLYCCWPPFAAWVEMTETVCAIRLFNSERPISSAKIYSAVNTPYEGCSIKALREYYHSAAQALCAKSPKAVTYEWSDNVLYYSRVSTLLMTPGGYIEVVASHNNDNNGVTVIFSDQPFSEKGRAGMKKLESYKLPEGFPAEQ